MFCVEISALQKSTLLSNSFNSDFYEDSTNTVLRINSYINIIALRKPEISETQTVRVYIKKKLLPYRNSHSSSNI